jgi:hypothetical protein
MTPRIAFLALLIAGCVRPGTSVDSVEDSATDAVEDVVEESTGDAQPEPLPDPPDDPAPDPAEVVEDVVEEDAPTDLPELPITFAPDFTLEDLNPNSPTYGDMRSVSEARGKVLLIYFGNFG